MGTASNIAWTFLARTARTGESSRSCSQPPDRIVESHSRTHGHLNGEQVLPYDTDPPCCEGKVDAESGPVVRGIRPDPRRDSGDATLGTHVDFRGKTAANGGRSRARIVRLMASGSHASSIFTFSDLELDCRSRELRKRGLKLRVLQQPFQVLSTLVVAAGDVVKREELAWRFKCR